MLHSVRTSSLVKQSAQGKGSNVKQILLLFCQGAEVAQEKICTRLGQGHSQARGQQQDSGQQGQRT